MTKNETRATRSTEELDLKLGKTSKEQTGHKKGVSSLFGTFDKRHFLKCLEGMSRQRLLFPFLQSSRGASEFRFLNAKTCLQKMLNKHPQKMRREASQVPDPGLQTSLAVWAQGLD